MNLRHFTSHLDIAGEHVRFTASAGTIKRLAKIESFYYLELHKLRYRDPNAFTLVMSFLAWRELQQDSEGFVLFDALRQKTQELAEEHNSSPATLDSPPPT